jgi:DNA-binding NarL/FixJ family response regulator
VFAALHAGARGYLTKDADAADIQRAIAAVAAGKAELDAGVQARLLDALARGAPVGVPTAARPAELPDALTVREAEVLTEIAAGLYNAEIAAKFVVSEATVKTHVGHLLAKTRMRDRAQLVAYAYRHGLLSP